MTPGASLAGTLDQQQTVSDTTAVIHSGSSTAQTFTAGLSGGVDQVDLKLAASGSPTYNLSIEIRDVSGGAPGAMVLASRSVPASSVPGTAAFVSINFALPAPVAAGTQYAIVAYSSTPSGNEYSWSISSANPYAGGNDFFTATTPPSGTWTPLASFDLAFKTYVTPAAADNTPPETMIGSKKIKGTKATFTFSSSEPGSTFQCKLDNHSFKPCSSPKKYKHLSSGKHKFRVQATDASGNVDASPAGKKFTI
jgi:hypothetical protein